MMGVYHLMGLGLSAGAVVGPLSYLAHRYDRWNPADQRFYRRSGERSQRRADLRVGDVQALILFTTKEVLNGDILAHSYVLNPPGRVTKGPEQKPGPMKPILRELLMQVWPVLSGGRTSASLFWCSINRRDLSDAYNRIVRVISALANVGKQGHEMWANLTGGNNVTNLALELAAAFSGEVARVYYVQAQDQDAERCVRHTSEDGYWVEIPIMPLSLSRVTLAVLDLLSAAPADTSTIYGKLCNFHWGLIEGIETKEALYAEYLRPMWKQGLIVEDNDKYAVGPRWELVAPYWNALEEARSAPVTIEQLSQSESWITHETIELKGGHL